MKITDLQKKEMEALGDDPIDASLKMHRSKLEAVSSQALEYIHEDLPDATIDQKVKVYDTTRRHLNIIDGIDNQQQSQQIIIIPGELVKDIYKEAKEQLSCNHQAIQLQRTTQPQQINPKSLSTPVNPKSPNPITVSG